MARKINFKIEKRELPYKLYYFVCEDAESMQHYFCEMTIDNPARIEKITPEELKIAGYNVDEINNVSKKEQQQNLIKKQREKEQQNEEPFSMS